MPSGFIDVGTGTDVAHVRQVLQRDRVEVVENDPMQAFPEAVGCTGFIPVTYLRNRFQTSHAGVLALDRAENIPRGIVFTLA